MPTIISYSSNNFGPYQNEEKLIPKIISCTQKNKAIPISSDGSNIRDWIFVDDHCNAINLILEKGKPGKEYCIGGSNEMSNLEICKLILEIIDTLIPCKKQKKYINKYPLLLLDFWHDKFIENSKHLSKQQKLRLIDQDKTNNLLDSLHYAEVDFFGEMFKHNITLAKKIILHWRILNEGFTFFYIRPICSWRN